MHRQSLFSARARTYLSAALVFIALPVVIQAQPSSQFIPITYAVDGVQYVAVNTGGGQINLAPELRPSRGTNLFVFALPND